LQTSADEVFIMDYLGETKSTIRLQSKSLGKNGRLKRFTPSAGQRNGCSRLWTFATSAIHHLSLQVKDDKQSDYFDEIERNFRDGGVFIKNRLFWKIGKAENSKIKNASFWSSSNLTRQAIPKLCVPRLVDQLHSAWDEKAKYFSTRWMSAA